jgi:hypothetical protein
MLGTQKVEPQLLPVQVAKIEIGVTYGFHGGRFLVRARRRAVVGSPSEESENQRYHRREPIGDYGTSATRPQKWGFLFPRPLPETLER